MTVTYRILVGEPEEKRPLGRPTLKWEDNIKMDIQTTPPLGSPGGSVSRGIFTQHTKRYETRYMEC